MTGGPLVGTPPAAARRSATRSRNSGNGQASGNTDQEKASSSQGRHPPAISRGTLLHPPGYSQTKERNYTHHSGSNAFLLRGLIMTSHSNPLPFLASLFVTLALGGLWLGFEAPYQWREASPAIPLIFGYLFAGTVVNMGVTAGRDPGVLPRGVDEEPILALPDGDDQDTSRRNDALAIPMPRIVRVRNGRDLTVKWCETCRLYRPPRASHCRVCDNCVEAIDHHCTFLNTCIARRNYMSFFAFLGLALATCAYGVVFCALHLYWLTLPSDSPSGRGGGKSGLGGALGTSPMSGVLFVLILLVMGPLTTLTSYHVRLIMMGRSTVEQVRQLMPRRSCFGHPD
ncbi:zf-DHHC-domain-containing protein [Jaminaea rosea]|uniref:Palmitoyltransferase n=1 Tax=Jaminaea rosea TaxID=1569628 RepID=A0A316UQW7_9BASI|nr:zf-DHHC-domain-containing protein [Jaminaea rosea]PWN27374.1 zf-DHHC-domain-containing protein [Jaminaea rosea]